MRMKTRLFVALVVGLLLGAGIAAVSPGLFWAGWPAAALLSAAAVYALLAAWQWAGGTRLLAWLTALAFALRLGLGLALSLGLPVYGYDEPEQNAGYLFYDAYQRDTQAWELAESGRPLPAAFGEDFKTDQYGGLLALSALVYRTLSPGEHRPFLILILAAFTFALGVPFFYRAVRERLGAVPAAAAGWILALYPDGILFSASQMREPFLIGLTCIAFWGVSAWAKPARRGSAAAALVSLVLMALFSSRVVIAAAGLLAAWFLLDRVYPHLSRRLRLAVWAAFGLAGLTALFFTWEWFASASSWDLNLLQKLSGQWLKALEPVGRFADMAALSIYGIARPLLPAAIGSLASERTPWIWNAVDIFRSAGWYALIPLLLYSFWAVLREKDAAQRRGLLLFAAAVLAWLFISSLRAGADQWDNPRYRTIFLPHMALLAGWGLDAALRKRDPWLLRGILVELIFLGFFTQWYLSRYWTWLGWRRWQFWEYVLWIGVWSAVVIAGGWLWDRLRARRGSS